MMWEVFGAQCGRELNRIVRLRSKELLASSPIPTESVEDNRHIYLYVYIKRRSVELQQEPTENITPGVYSMAIHESFISGRALQALPFVTIAQLLIFLLLLPLLTEYDSQPS